MYKIKLEVYYNSNWQHCQWCHFGILSHACDWSETQVLAPPLSGLKKFQAYFTANDWNVVIAYYEHLQLETKSVILFSWWLFALKECFFSEFASSFVSSGNGRIGLPGHYLGCGFKFFTTIATVNIMIVIAFPQLQGLLFTTAAVSHIPIIWPTETVRQILWINIVITLAVLMDFSDRHSPTLYYIFIFIHHK